MQEVRTSDSTTLSNFIWKVADDLWGDFKHTDFARIIIPLLLLRRLECVLEPTKEAVLKEYENEKDSGIDLDLILPSFSGLPFYNISQYTLDTLGGTNTRANLEDYISKFSANVRVIFEEFGFINTIHELDKARLLYRMTRQFAAIDLHPEVVSDRVMSNAYEDLIRQFAASINEKAGEFMTPKDVVRLATKLVLAPDEAVFSEKGVIRTVYDPACGLLGFISDAIDQINQMGSTATIVPFGQELDPKTHAMALTAMLIRGYKSENIAQGSTLSNDLHRDKRFHYGLANPPFGIKWEKDKPAVEKEHKELGYAGRFGPGLPRVSDGSMLFLMHLVSKMERPENGGGRVGIVLSGSPLFTGDAGSGESEIRRWLLEQDLVEAIVALPTDMFFNTGIGTYVWILSNHKEKRRKGKVQLINLSDTWSAMRKSEGTKRRFLSDDQIDDIVREYADFTETERSKIFKTTDFAYRKVAIKRPLKAKLVITKAKIKTLFDQKAFEKLDEAQQTAWIDYFRELISQPNGGQQEYTWAFEIVKAKNKEEGFGKTTKALANAFIAAFMERDEDAEPVLDDNGRVIPDTSLNDTESVPFGTLVEDYFKAEVLPHVADAFIDYSVRDSKDGEVGIVGYEINFNRYFYRYVEPRNQGEIEVDLSSHESKIRTLLDELEKRQKRITSAIFSGLKNDSGFKDSGVSWIGSIPESWDVKPMFSYVTESKISNKGMVEDNLLSLSYGKIKRKNIDTLGGLLPESYETYQIVNKGDVVFRLTDLQNDKRSLRSALCMERGIITSAYIAVTPKGIRPKYFNFLMRAYDEVKVFYNLGSGMRQSLKYSELKRLPILCPPDSVQRDIEEFIDKEINDIESIVEELNYFIDLLKEYRSSIVHCAALGMLKA